MTTQKRTLPKRTIIGIVTIIIAAFMVFALPKIGEDVKNEEIVVNQVPFTGELEYWTTPGFKWQWFGKTTSYYKTQQMWFNDSEDGNKGEDKAIPIIFNDAGNGKIYGSLRVKLPTDPKFLQRIQTDYTGMDRLMNDLIRPTAIKVVYASGPLMSSFESYAEKKNDLIRYITDQLNNGVYQTNTKEVKVIDQLSGEEKVIRVADIIADSLSAGGYKRQEISPFSYYGLEVGQVSISKIAYDDKILAQISTQQEANMAVQTSKAQAMEAKQQAIRAEEEGKAKAVTAKWKQEELKAVDVTKAEQAFEVAKYKALEALETAKKVKAVGEADAYAAKLKVQAGLSPVNDEVYENISAEEEKIILAQ